MAHLMRAHSSHIPILFLEQIEVEVYLLRDEESVPPVIFGKVA
jgi:hypothetical protein